jgi:hypothetical protein
MTTLSTEPVQLADAPRCGAKTRGARGGRPCRSPAMANGKCRMHGGRSAGPTGKRNGAYRHGKYTKEAKAVSAWARDLARDIDVFGAVTMTAAGGKPHRAVRRKVHVRKALARIKAAAKASKGEKTE